MSCSVGCRRAALAVALLSLAAGSRVDAETVRTGALVIAAPWARATPKGAPVGGGYVTITNTGTTPDALTSATLVSAGRVEIHDMSISGGVMQMRRHDGALTIAPGETVTLTPAGTHLMLMDLKAPLIKGEPVSGTLVFEKAGAVAVRFAVEGFGAMKPSEEAAKP